MQNIYVRIPLLLFSIATHLGLIFAFGGVHNVEKASPKQGLVTTTVELFQAGTQDSDSPHKSSYEHIEKIDASEDNLSLSQTLKVGTSQTLESDTFGLTDIKMQNGKEEISFLPVIKPSEPYYFSMNELSEMPQVVLDLSPSLVFSLPNASAQLAVLRLLINEQGGIDQVLTEDSLLSESDQRLVIDTFLKTKFQPGKINGVLVRSQMTIEVRLDAGFDSQ